MPIRRKAGSGTRVEQKAATDQNQGSYGQLVGTGATAAFPTNKSFLTKPSFVGKAIGQSGIILNNVKGTNGGNIRQIKDMGSNPGSRVGS